MFTEIPVLTMLGSWGLDHFFSWGLDSGVFTSAVTAVTADHCLSPPSEGIAFVSQVSSNTWSGFGGIVRHCTSWSRQLCGVCAGPVMLPRS